MKCNCDSQRAFHPNKICTGSSRCLNGFDAKHGACGIAIAAGAGMPLELAKVTREMMTELRRTYRDGLPTEDLEPAVCAYVKYWTDRSLAEQAIKDLIDVLLDQARYEQRRLERRDLTSMDAVIAVVVARCLMTPGFRP